MPLQFFSEKKIFKSQHKNFKCQSIKDEVGGLNDDDDDNDDVNVSNVVVIVIVCAVSVNKTFT